MKDTNTKFFLRPVSRYYFYDWQFAIDIHRATLLKFISIIFIIIPSVIDSQKSQFISIPVGFIIASFTFLLSWLIIKFCSPKFIKEYRDYGQYKTRQHSHRWIIWEFYNNLESLSGWRYIVNETVSKGLSIEFDSIKKKEIKDKLNECFIECEEPIKAYMPVNINRDIYMPILLEGKKYILFLKEDDKKLEEKEKELFWILYSQVAKEKYGARILFWLLILITILSTIWAVGKVIIKLLQ